MKCSLVRLACVDDVDTLGQMMSALWPAVSASEHAAEAALIVDGRPPTTLPLVILVAEVGREVAGFIEVGLRSHVDGCDPRRPVGFIEGWFVDATHRAHGVGRALMAAAERWALDQGCTEIGSDTWLDNEPSQLAHQALGFAEVDRCVHYRKSLR